ncbi:DNA-binding transcriptional MerR regulator [Acidovorax sp. 93]|uniref:Cd(II)/Pb(II)-responsive transcriptional regulator n=1 Tax=Acidovorax sp. 93 TaxID=2135632 RepID=UPI000EB5DB59|nr:Cd(II)/Pb(II)-responsive transcriptional regulator [Acidovorax sp. 93]RKR26783.1 DNA-binding transcriptional MerR regulator [Acidovorax sp. 93]
MDQNAVQFRIGEAALQSGVSAANIRYYEKEGLLPHGVRGDNSYRLYSGADVHQLRFIRLCRAMDMSLHEVRTLLALDWSRKEDCDAARDTLDDHLQHVRARLAELQTLEADLLALRNRCDGTDAHCHIIEALHARADAQPAVPFATAAAKRHV